ncbi:oxidation resistance protein 1 [Clydaea vesicula]|uniref:Oxidation resistance protein 1 n=1 Tax=Clydaea vesicula TaxID=447962 RepID=A0AAD5U3L4_9FUNG|nr:oxidation resistance protein 1 [Clydaea vesicula]
MYPTITLTGGKEGNLPILTVELAKQIQPHLPPLQKEASIWNLVYSLEQHGISLATMFHNTPNKPALLVIKDTNKNVFGAFSNEGFKRQLGFYGNGSCFLWKKILEQSTEKVKVFKSTGSNNYHILSEIGADIAFGGGTGKFGLWLDATLDNGYSSNCPTFENEALSTTENFHCDCVEVWQFVI